MKKFFAIAIAAVAMSFASCGGKTGANANPDSLAAEPAAAAEQIVSLLQEQIKNADVEQIKAIGTTVSETVAAFIAKGDNEAAQTYADIISNFIDNNADKLKEIGAATTLTEALAAVAALPVNTVNAAQSAADASVGLAEDQADAAAASVENAKQAVENAAKAQVDAAKAAAAAQAAAAKAAADAKVQEGKDAANKAIDDAAAAAKKQLGL